MSLLQSSPHNMPAHWTIMVYMAGDNNLDSLGVTDLLDMKRVGSTTEVNIVAEFDRRSATSPTRRYHLRPYNITPSLRDDVVEELSETDSGSPSELTSFIQWGMKHYRATNYMVIIWAHGSGAYDEDLYYSTPGPSTARRKRGVFTPTSHTLSTTTKSFKSLMNEMRLIAPDDQAKDFIDNVELKGALEAVGQKIDVLGMDACLMSMIEVCYQLRNSVGITVASEAEEPLVGWPYEGFLRRLTEEPQMNARKLSETIIDEFVRLYNEFEDTNTTLAACDLSICPEVVDQLASLTATMLDHIDESEVFDSIMLARYLAKADDVIDEVDLYDFCELLERKCPNEEIRNCCRNLRRVFDLSGAIIKTQPLIGPVQHWHGLGIYFPSTEVSELYGRLDIVQPGVTRWKEFIDMYVSLPGR